MTNLPSLPPLDPKKNTMEKMRQGMIMPPSPPQITYHPVPDVSEPSAEPEIIDDENDKEVQVSAEDLKQSMQSDMSSFGDLTDTKTHLEERFDTRDQDEEIHPLEIIHEELPSRPSETEEELVAPPTSEELEGDSVTEFEAFPDETQPEHETPRSRESFEERESHSSKPTKIAQAIAFISAYLTPEDLGKEMHETLHNQFQHACGHLFGSSEESEGEEEIVPKVDMRELLLNHHPWPVFPEADCISRREAIQCKHALITWMDHLDQLVGLDTDNWSQNSLGSDEGIEPASADNPAYVNIRLVASMNENDNVDISANRVVNYPSGNVTTNRRVIAGALDQLDSMRNRLADEESSGREIEDRLTNGKYQEKSYTWAVDAENVLMKCFPEGRKTTKFSHKAALAIALAARPIGLEPAENQIGKFAISSIWKDGGMDILGTLLEIAKVTPDIKEVHILDSSDAATKFLGNFGPLIIVNNNVDGSESVLVNISINVKKEKVVYMNLSKDHYPDLVAEEAMPLDQFKQLIDMSTSAVIAVEAVRRR